MILVLLKCFDFVVFYDDLFGPPRQRLYIKTNEYIQLNAEL